MGLVLRGMSGGLKRKIPELSIVCYFVIPGVSQTSVHGALLPSR